MTERWGWQGLYYFDITWGLTFLLLAWRFLRPTPRAMRLSEIDWLGYVILAIGLAAFILFMKQGDRFFWLDKPNDPPRRAHRRDCHPAGARCSCCCGVGRCSISV